MTKWWWRYWELSYRDAAVNSDKFYRLHILVDAEGSEARLLREWGRRGATGQRSLGVFSTEGAAMQEMLRVRDSKVAKGYLITKGGDEPQPAPPDVLLKAGVSQGVKTTTDVITDTSQFVLSQIQHCQRLAMGDADDQKNAIVMRAALIDATKELRQLADQMDGSLVFLTTLIGARVGAA